jgi:hypothetical protein
MIIPFNKPYMTGKELWYISKPVRSRAPTDNDDFFPGSI